jgi:LysM repeat protein
MAVGAGVLDSSSAVQAMVSGVLAVIGLGGAAVVASRHRQFDPAVGRRGQDSAGRWAVNGGRDPVVAGSGVGAGGVNGGRDRVVAGAGMGVAAVRAGRDRRGARVAHGGVRLTRRGRMVVYGLGLALAAVLVVLTAPASQAADPAGAAPTVVVEQGDSLWSIAARYAPSSDPFGTIEQIRELNGLPGYTVEAGQKLTLPRRR